MSSLIAVGFKDEFTADAVLLELRKLQKEHLIDLEDAAVVIRDKDGKVKIKQTQELTTAGALSGGFWGLLFGFIFFNPLLGWAVGAIAGGISGAFSDIGIDDNFIREVGSAIEPNTSAIFVLVRRATPDKVLEDLSRFNGKVLKTSLSNEDEAKLQAVLTKS
ncbi:DUF1269 domain-containing protein [Phormidium tenue]|jgi:uncharacterized membrane protein|uniref:DUF1269 domain-containing protein n=1 Tax=Phormidium tenue FACHB-1050 TaxID=2692857 RepID=A0ABR8CB76_9CYAN|nr:DUF1269 domain-containing protein [Phormidium tenue]MBD2317635.1 DUF1269 domain-containing protein [Phormidium tenue FACHB-1050]